MEILDHIGSGAHISADEQSPGEVVAVIAKAAAHGEFELFKMMSIYDGTATHPAWLGDEPERVQRVMPE
jgi:hypothetical protein